ncbi:MAG TPA: hypothetical protein VFA30_04045 [Gaiellaceae bacterium]|nr:hypothetical protein [Gaiellaceae bacterium]
MTTRIPHTTRVFLAGVATLLALVGASTARAAPDSAQPATPQCWKQVINDWAVHQPNLTGTYPIPCYTQALQHLSQYPDIQGYSSAPDDIRRALYAVIHEEGRGGGPTSFGGGTGGSPGGSSGGGLPTKGSGGLVHWFQTRLQPGGAQSVPLPLIVLGCLAVLLLLAAAATWITRRMQTRRVPAPAPAPAPAPRRR